MFFRSLLLVLTVQLAAVLSQTLPFVITGFLDSATPNSGDAINRGGTVQISGFTVKIPDNLLVEFPALFVPFAEFCGGQKAGPNEVTITGNIVGDVIIAGQMSVAQLDLAAASGVIERLDFDGAIKIKNGPILRLNDPNAKYSKGFTALPFFTADDENPSITSFSGFPVCVPRELVDPKCPLSNRATAARNIPDALHMAPLKVGDYIEYSGVQFNGETIVYSLVANIDILTSGTQPGFIRVEDAIIGVTDAGVDVEAARHRFIGLASRSDLLVSIYAVDQDPCTGAENERLITSVSPIASNRNKWTIDIPKNSNIGFYTRNYHIKIGSNIITTTDGIKAGLYVQPVTEWIFPELVTPGGAPPPLNFANIGHLVNGFGPIDGTIFGPLRPWPGATSPAPAVSVCPTLPTGGGEETPSNAAGVISARAGIDQTLLGGLSVQLSAKNDTGSGSGLTYLWSQTAGPTVALSSNSMGDITFAAPVVTSSTNVQREFRVIITQTTSKNQGNDTVVVTTVSLPKAQALQSYDTPVINSLTWATKQSGTATAIASSNLVDSTASMRIIFNSDNVERVMTKVGVNNGVVQYTFNGRSIKSYTSATIRSYLNNVAVGGPNISSSVVSSG